MASVAHRSISTKVDEPLSIPPPRLFDPEAGTTQHCQTNPKHLPRAKMSVGNLGLFQKFVKQKHESIPLTKSAPHQDRVAQVSPLRPGAALASIRSRRRTILIAIPIFYQHCRKPN